MSVNIRLKHSSTAAKVPLPSDLTDGELALNTNSSDPAIYLKDSAGTIRRVDGVKNASVTVSDTPPSSPANGDLWWNSSDSVGTLFIYYTDVDSSQWVETAGSEGALPEWVRDGTTLKPANDGDDVDLGNIQLNADGSGAFTSKLTTSQLLTNSVNLSDTDSHGCQLGQAIQVQRKLSTDATNYFIRGLHGATETYRVNLDGAVLIGGLPQSAPNITLNADGSAAFKNDINYGLTGYLADSDIGKILTGTADGTFGTVLGIEPSKSYSLARDFVVCLNKANKTGRQVLRIDGETGNASYAAKISASDVTFNLETDNDANFSAEGEYTGPTLDVKELLLKLVTAADRIEALEAKVQALKGGSTGTADI